MINITLSVSASPVLTLALILVGGLVCLANLACFIGNIRGVKHSSPVPFVGGATLFAGIWLASSGRHFAWLAFAVDWGTICALISSPWLIKDLWSTTRFRLVEQFTGESEGFKATLQLFRGQIWVLKRDFKLQAGEHGLLSSISTGRYRNESGLLILESADCSFTLRPSNAGGLDEWELSEKLEVDALLPPKLNLVLRRLP